MDSLPLRGIAMCLLLAATAPQGRKLLVGQGKAYAMPMQAAPAARDGDTVEIDAGAYDGEVATWSADNLVLRGAGPFARLNAPAAIPNGKAIWVIQGDHATVENVEFAGARVPDQNGAGIRQEGDDLTVRHCFFHDNENGILGGGGAASNVLIEYSEFSSNGHGDGYSHNLYIDRVASLTFRFCNTRLARIGHLIKSRARVNHILYNRIMDEATGTASYQVDMPNGGIAYVIGNSIQQGPDNGNPILIAFGEEGHSNPGRELHVVNNTMVNQGGSGTFIEADGADVVKVVNNLFVGPGQMLGSPGDTSANLVFSGAAASGLANAAAYDYHLLPSSPAVNRGVDPGMVHGLSLAPAFEYLHNAQGMARAQAGALDVGAHEYAAGGSIRKGRGNMRPSSAPVVLFLGVAPENWADARGRRPGGSAARCYWRVVPGRERP